MRSHRLSHPNKRQTRTVGPRLKLRDNQNSLWSKTTNNELLPVRLREGPTRPTDTLGTLPLDTQAPLLPCVQRKLTLLSLGSRNSRLNRNPFSLSPNSRRHGPHTDRCDHRKFVLHLKRLRSPQWEEGSGPAHSRFPTYLNE